LHSGQEALTPAQEAEAERWVLIRAEAQLATESVEKPEVERLLCQAYAGAGLLPPQHMQWVNAPLDLVSMLAQRGVYDEIVWGGIRRRLDNVWGRVRVRMEERARVVSSVHGKVRDSLSVLVLDRMEERVHRRVGSLLWRSLYESVRDSEHDSG
jgi:hypothetical protein